MFNPNAIKFGLKLSPVMGRKMFQFKNIKDVKDVPNTDFTDRPTFTFDQGQLGSCVFNACGMSATDVDFVKNGTPYIVPARLAPYYEYRKRIGEISDDTGASGYDCCNVYKDIGLGPESLNPYDTSKFTEAPSAEYLAAAQKNQLLGFEQIDISNRKIVCDLLRAALFDHGTLFPFGARLPNAFMSQSVADSGEFMSCNPLSWLSIVGGHEMTLAGSVRPLSGESFEPFFWVLNSWGENWGQKGKNGKRGFFKVSEKIMAKWLLEANVITQMEA